MKRAATILVVALLGAGLTASGAIGATGSASKSKPWQAVAGLFKTNAAASSQVSKLSGKGFSGYTVETEKRGQFSNGKKFEVERSFATQKQAKAAVAKLHKAKLTGKVENEKSE
jgi:hypothetical protein